MTPDEARQKATAIAFRNSGPGSDQRHLADDIAAALLSAAGQWQTMESVPNADQQQTIVLFDAKRKMAACASTAFPRWRKSFIHTMLLGLRMIRPSPTHWIALPPLPSPPAQPDASLDGSE